MNEEQKVRALRESRYFHVALLATRGREWSASELVAQLGNVVASSSDLSETTQKLRFSVPSELIRSIDSRALLLGRRQNCLVDGFLVQAEVPSAAIGRLKSSRRVFFLGTAFKEVTKHLRRRVAELGGILTLRPRYLEVLARGLGSEDDLVLTGAITELIGSEELKSVRLEGDDIAASRLLDHLDVVPDLLRACERAEAGLSQTRGEPSLEALLSIWHCFRPVESEPKMGRARSGEQESWAHKPRALKMKSGGGIERVSFSLSRDGHCSMWMRQGWSNLPQFERCLGGLVVAGRFSSTSDIPAETSGAPQIEDTNEVR